MAIAASTGLRTPLSMRREIWRLNHFDGISKNELASRFKRSWKTIDAICRDQKNSSGKEWSSIREALESPDPRVFGELVPDAARALNDFGYFRRRYFGRIASPWQEHAAQRIVEFLETPAKEYVVINAPPGSGKSTLFTHDIPAWLACRNRSIRCLIGSRTASQAKLYTGRLRRTFERTQPVPVDELDVKRGRAVTPEACLVGDYGRFRPVSEFTTDVWRAEEFVIAQPDDVLVSEKEASFAAFGMDSGFLGGRYDLCVWDDLVDKKTLRTAEARENLKWFWENEAETRLEPGGLLVLQGQRMGAEDLYRFALDQLGGDDEEDEEDEAPPPKYHHVVYRAHYEEVCAGGHKLASLPWAPPASAEGEVLRGLFGYAGGCLLDPVRLPWRELATIRANRMEKFEVLYQQRDVDPENVLVPVDWIDGGVDPRTGEEYPGCLDWDRRLGEVPRGLAPPVHSIATADPSPTQYWAVQWWLYHPATNQRFLIDIERRKMDAPEFLDRDPGRGTFTGLMEEWQARSHDLGHPISTWIVEANAAQRFLLQYAHVRDWQRKWGVGVVPHQTHRNKSDPDFGVQSIAPHYRYGRVRLPAEKKDPLRHMIYKLIHEVTRWPEGASDDCVMAQWFLEWNLPRLFPAHPRHVSRTRRPSWLPQTRRTLAGVGTSADH